MITATTGGVEATRELGAALARLVRPGDIVLLSGDLGAGKTALVQGVARGLGVRDRVTSPTFTLAHDYAGTELHMHHLDVYRIERLQEAVDLGLPEMVDDGGVTLIEWGDVVIPELPSDYLEVRLSFGTGDDDRVLRLRTVGSRWAARSRALTEALAPWADGAAPC